MINDERKKAVTQQLAALVEEALIAEGYLDDVADGSAGPKTQEAIAAYRKANGMSEDGGADEEMLEKLLGAGYDGNLLDKEDVFAAGETRILYVPKEDPAEAEPEEEQAPEYVISFREKDQEKEYHMYAFPVEDLVTAELNLDGDIAYVMYTSGEGADPVSTLDAEKEMNEKLHPAPAAPANNSAGGYEDYGYDMGYDTGYDAGYAEPAPVSNEPYVVFEEFYPSCDDGSHGVHYIEYSDGTTAQIEY